MTWPLSLPRLALLIALMTVLAIVPALAEQQVVDLTIRDGTLPPEQRVIRVQ